MMTISNIPVAMLTSTIPQTADIICTVKTEKYPLGAALIRFRDTGIYGLICGSVVSACDQMEAKRTHEQLSRKENA